MTTLLRHNLIGNNGQRHRLDETIVLLGIMVGCSLVPSLQSGISSTELAVFGAAVVCCALCIVKTQSLKPWPREIWFFAVMAAWTPMCIVHTDIIVFLTNAAGVYIFLGCLIIGFRLSPNQRRQAAKLLFLLVFVGTLQCIFLDLVGWAELGSEKTTEAWSPGVRGDMTSNGLCTVLLIAFAAPGLFTGDRVKRIFSVLLVALGFWVVAIMGQGRGAIILACLGVLCCARTNKQRAAVVCVLASLITIAVFLSMRENDYVAPLIVRFEEFRDPDSNTRLQDTQYGLNVMWRNGWKGLFLGIPTKEIIYEQQQLRNTGSGIHNGYLEIMTRYGAPSAIAFCAFCVSLGVKVLRAYRCANGLPNWVVTCTAWVILFLIITLVGAPYARWQGNVGSGLLIGMWLAYIHPKRVVVSIRERRSLSYAI